MRCGYLSAIKMHGLASTTCFSATARARETCGGLLWRLLLAILMPIPGQDHRVLDGELIACILLLAGIGAPWKATAGLEHEGSARSGGW
jgi:hypothetical protein